MEGIAKVSAFAASALLCVGLLFPQSSSANEAVHIRFAGIGYATHADPNQDGFSVDLNQATAQGTFGRSTIWITSEFMIHPRQCPEGYDVPLTIVNVALVLTVSDQSQLFGFSQEGWLCLNSVTGAYVGEGIGIYRGGTGRFAEASGEWVGKFEGDTIDPAIDFRSFRGTVDGHLD